jgi:hypothetical protein
MITPFQDAARGWAFADAAGLKQRIARAGPLASNEIEQNVLRVMKECLAEMEPSASQPALEPMQVIPGRNSMTVILQSGERVLVCSPQQLWHVLQTGKAPQRVERLVGARPSPQFDDGKITKLRPGMRGVSRVTGRALHKDLADLIPE